MIMNNFVARLSRFACRTQSNYSRFSQNWESPISQRRRFSIYEPEYLDVIYLAFRSLSFEILAFIPDSKT